MNNKDTLRTSKFKEIKDINIINILKDKDDDCLDIFDFRCHYCPLAYWYFNKCATNDGGCYLMKLVRTYYKNKYMGLLKNKDVPWKSKFDKEIKNNISEKLKKSRKFEKRLAFLCFQRTKFSMLIDTINKYHNGNRFFDERCHKCPILTRYRTFKIQQKIAEIDIKIWHVDAELYNISLSFKFNRISKEEYEQRAENCKNKIAKLKEGKDSIKTPKSKDKWLINYQISQDKQWLKRKEKYINMLKTESVNNRKEE